MEHEYFIDRIRKVINSCENVEQLEIALKYATILINRYIKDNDIPISIKEKLLKWINFLIEGKDIDFKLKGMCSSMPTL